MVERNRWNRSVTAQQKKLVRYSVRDILVTKEMVEYTDFLLQSAMGNAAEFIFCAIEQGLDLISKRGELCGLYCKLPLRRGCSFRAGRWREPSMTRFGRNSSQKSVAGGRTAAGAA